MSAEEVETEYQKALKILEDIEFKKMLSGQEDQLSAMIEINPGAGGTESNDWAEMLMRMYMMWGEKMGFKVKQVNYQPGDVAGLKSATLEIDREFAYGQLKSETAGSTVWFESHLSILEEEDTLPLPQFLLIQWWMTP